MFTGIIEELGKIQQINSNKIEIECNKVLEDAKIGDSIAVNGVCLTVIEIVQNICTFDVSPETFRVTALGNMQTGDFVNLERAMSVNGRFGGHIVSGHIDERGKIKFISKNSDFYLFKIEISSELSKYVIKKGSITINGISLTVADINGNLIECAIIPHTFKNTNLKYLKLEDFVNIEVDMLAKYVEKFLSTSDNKSRIDEKFLIDNGYL